MKKKAHIGMALVLVSSLVLSGCAGGISREAYDNVVTERDAAQADLATARAEAESLQADLTTAEAEIETLSADLATAQAEIETLQANISAAEERFQALYMDNASLALKHHELEARYEQLVEDFAVLRPQYEEPSPSALPVTIIAENLDITIKEAYFADRVANFRPFGKFVVLTLEVTNVGRTLEYLFTGYFLVIGHERRFYPVHDFGYNGPTGFIWRTQQITGEATIEVKLAFDVPIDEHDLYILVTMEDKMSLWTSAALGL